MNHHKFVKNRNFKIAIIVFLITTFTLAQSPTNRVEGIQSVQTDGEYGPTLIICSNKDSSYEKSVTKYFGIKKGTSNKIGDFGYKMVRVGGTAPVVTEGYQPLPHYPYLNKAIEDYLKWNYQHIIILEGEYEVNGSIIIDNLGGSTTSIGTGRITIEG
jgi:hypothetical protein